LKPRVLHVKNMEAVEKALKSLHVSTKGIEIMAPKAVHHLVKVYDLDPRAANIVKQEMLSKGGEAATPWELYKMDTKNVDLILMGTLRQYDDLCGKLSLQPFGLPVLAQEIKKALFSYDKKTHILQAGRYNLDLSSRTHIMGVLNVTPDSFSDGGEYFDSSQAKEQAQRLVEDGADILDVGGESTRPGAEPVTLEEELRRTIPVIEELSGEFNVPISIDTYKPEVARRALEAGATIINDISGLRDEKMIELAVEKNVPVVIMHMKGTPTDMQKNPTYDDVVAEVAEWLDIQAQHAIAAGLPGDKILIDPGIGFGKNLEHNLELLRRLSELKSLGYPIVLGTSRKSFIGAILNLPAQERIEGTIASIVYGVTQGASIMRVHDVKEVARAIKVADAIRDGNV